MEQLAKKLKSKKLKVTPQRLAIYKELIETDSHPSAETLYNSIKKNYPTMSFATVYKTLDALKTAGLIVAVNVGEDSFRYDANIDKHAHLVCKKCNSVKDIYIEMCDTIVEQVNSKTKFEVQENKLFLYGICEKCQLEN